MFPNNRIAVFLAGLAAIGVVLGIASLSQRVPLKDFEHLAGPEEFSIVAPAVPADWHDYADGGDSRLAIFLTNENSAWLGLALGLKTIGVPFLITDDVDTATRHHVVLAYPAISGQLLNASELGALRVHVENGGTLIATQVLGGGLQDIFGFNGVIESRSHSEVTFSPGHDSLEFINHPKEHVVRLGSPELPDRRIGTQAFEYPSLVLATYEDGSAALISNANENGGEAFALGFDLGFFILKALNDRDSGASRAYANDYEPSVDVWLRWLRAVYQLHEADHVIVGTVPEGRDLAVVVSFDIDYAESIFNMSAYRDILVRHNLKGTFFVQTKYFRDSLDDAFFNDRTLENVRSIASSGMEIGSHSVAHSDMFSALPLGTGTERYPDYQPRVIKQNDTRGASVLGEIRVSKYLLGSITDEEVVSFRPGYLATPAPLPEALDATGYKYASTVTAGNVLTHLPYRMTHNRNYAAKTGIFQFPIAIEDEIPPHLDLRLQDAADLAGQLAEYGGSFVILLHPNILDEKMSFLSDIIPAIEPFSWFGTLEQYGNWWSMRDGVSVDVRRDGHQAVLTAESPNPMHGLSFRLDSKWTPSAALEEGVSFLPGNLFVDDFSNWIEVRFDVGTSSGIVRGTGLEVIDPAE